MLRYTYIACLVVVPVVLVLFCTGANFVSAIRARTEMKCLRTGRKNDMRLKYAELVGLQFVTAKSCRYWWNSVQCQNTLTLDLSGFYCKWRQKTNRARITATRLFGTAVVTNQWNTSHCRYLTAGHVKRACLKYKNLSCNKFQLLAKDELF